MEPGQFLVVLLYLWLFTALGVYAWRGYRRVVHNETRADRAARRATAAGGPWPAAEGGPAARAAADPPADRPAVADLVAGIVLPCDLVPLVAGELDPQRAVFAAMGHTTAEVGAALAAELVRLGFALRTVDAHEAVAERDGATLRLRIHADGPQAHPSAPRHSVVAELSTP